MSTNFASIRSAILTKLNGIVGAGQPLAQVKAYHDENFTGFPCASFEPSGNENMFYTNTDNLRGYAFDVVVWQEIESGGRANAVTVLTTAVDAIIAAFDSDYNLSGACDFVEPVPSAWKEIVVGEATFKYAVITIKCKAEINPNSN